MAKNSAEWQEGYDAAIEAIKQAIENGQDPSQGGGDGEGLEMPNMGGSQSDSQSGGGNNSNEYHVTPEDCMGPGSLSDIPGTPGGMIDQSEGDKIAKSEGYDEGSPGSDAAQERDWKDAALKALKDQKWTGDGGKGRLKNKLEKLYKSSKDWRKEFRKVIGHAISPEDKRQAYANKNILISQDRIARTDKDKYDHISYMVIILDTSGSMWNDKIRMMMTEAYHVALQKKPLRIVTIQNDADIHEVMIHNNLRDFEKYVKTIDMKGGGGNDLRPAWNFLTSGHPKFMNEFNKIRRAGPAEIVMNFTDGYLDQLKRNPRTMKNLCWAIVDNPGFDIKYKDANTRAVYLDMKDIK